MHIKLAFFCRWSRQLITPALCLLLVACASGTAIKPLATKAPSGATAARPTEGKALLVNPTTSWIKVLVFRSGALANLGHNHVVRFQGLSGEVVLQSGNLAEGWLELIIDPHSAVIDDSADRSSAGPRFDTEPTEKDIAGTRANMLGERVLASEAFPEIKLRSTGADLVEEELRLDLQVVVRDTTRELTVPVQAQFKEGKLQAESRFALSQAELGLEPFSVLGGALAVADVLEIEVYVEAE